MYRQSIAADLWTQLSSKLEARIQDREKERYFYSYREFEVDNSGVVPKLGNELPKCFIAILKISSAESIKKLGDLLKLDDPIEQKKSEFLRVGFWRFEFTIDYRNSNILVVKARFNGQYGSADETLLPIYDLEKSFRASGFEKQEIGENQFWEFAQVTETFEQFFKSI